VFAYMVACAFHALMEITQHANRSSRELIMASAMYRCVSGLSDRLPPSVSAISIVSSHTNAVWASTGKLVTLQFTSSEPLLLTGGSPSSVAFKTPTSDNVVRGVAFVSGSLYRATFTVGSASPFLDPTADGLLSFVLTAKDLAGNSVTATTAGSGSVTVGT